MPAPVFVDTNLFVYARDANAAEKQHVARAWLDSLWRERSGRTSTQVLSEYFVTVTRKLRPGLDPADAWDDVAALMTWRPAPNDESALRSAREIQLRHQLSWWDSLVVASALRQQCALLLTEDLQDGTVFGNVTVRSPFRLGAGEPSPAPYEATSQAARRHPARGRPRRPVP